MKEFIAHKIKLKITLFRVVKRETETEVVKNKAANDNEYEKESDILGERRAFYSGMILFFIRKKF